LFANITRQMTQEEDPEGPHDVLAAEEFGVPAPDPMLAHEPLEVPSDPDDPEGELPPHDVLAGEEFPIPAAPARGADAESTGGSRRPKGVLGGAAVAVLGLVALVRRRRRG